MEKMTFTYSPFSPWLKNLAFLLAFTLLSGWQASAQPQLLVLDAAGQAPAASITQMLPEGQCTYSFQWTVAVYDPAGAATATVSIATSPPAALGPDATLVQPGGSSTYLLNATAAVGVNTLTIRKNGPSGPVTQTYTINVIQNAATGVNLACNANLNATLDANCQRFITADMVLEGGFGCADEADFRVHIVNDDDPTNGNILDGHGQFIYEVTYVGPDLPSFNWEDCWGFITGEDKAAPGLGCPGDTDQGTVVIDCYTTTGELTTASPSMEPLNFSCFIDGQAGIDAGLHYYSLIPFQVDRTDYYTILVSDQFVTSTGGASAEQSAIALFQGGFSPSNPCENIIAFQDEPISNVTPPLAAGEPSLRLSLPLIAGETYYLWVTSDDALATGSFTLDICPDENGRVGLFATSTVLNPQTWEPTTVNTTVLWPRRDVSLSLPLFCDDFDLIFNNPASLSITGRPTVNDNCDDNVAVSFVDTYTSAGDCSPILITRTFSAVDDAGNERTCQQLITLNRPGAQDVDFPPRTVPIECDEQFATLPNGHPHPSISGYPFILTVSGIRNLAQSYCNIGASFVDRAPVSACAGALKFVRDWTVIDWCDGDNLGEDAQVIKVGDFTAPTVACPAPGPLAFSTSPFSCTAAFSVPLPNVTDNCSGYEVKTEIVTEVEVQVVNQYGIVTGVRTDTVVVRLLPWNAPSRLVSGIPAGEHYFRYTVEDDCGNQVVKYCPFSVRDQVAPTAICDDNFNISIGGADFSRIYADDIDEGSNDNCGEVDLAVRRSGVVLDQFGRVVPFVCGNQRSPWAPHVDFYCCDVGRTVTIELRVQDEYGNENICWLDIVPEEKVKPYCYAPHPATIGCDALPYDFEPTDTVQLQQLFGDATSADNCSSLERELPPVANLECGFGTIIRRFKAIDIHGNESINLCTQTVTIREVHNYEIRFPADAEAACGVADAESVTYEEIGCDLLAVNYTDEVFSASGTECYKVFRRWRVINWCQYDGASSPLVIGRDEDCDGRPGDEAVWALHRPGGKVYIDRDNDETEPNNVPRAFQNVCNGIDDFWRKVDDDGGFYQYTQVIKVYDDIRPEIIAADTAFCSYDNVNCTGLVGLPFRIDENCTPGSLQVRVFLDAGADGTVDADLQNLADGLFDDFRLTGDYPNYRLNGRFPIGCHAFDVRVEDGCGNTNSKLLDFCVVDCKAPSPICINGLAIELMPVDLDGDDAPDEGRMGIWASDFIVSPGSDCTGPITYSINRVGSPANADSTGLILTCADTGTLIVEVWAYDQTGNSDYCETYLLVQDNMGLCGPDSLTVAAAGAVVTEADIPVENVQVSLSGQASAAMTTASDGAYRFSGLLENYDYSITPFRNDGYLNGVSTFDLVLISKHILGVQPLGSPYRMIAADVNNSRSITTLDLIQLRKLILSIDTEFQNNTSWRFVRRSYAFPRPNNPWFEPFPEVININNLAGSGLSDADFVAIKVGDVNLDAQANSLMGVQGRKPAGALTFEVEDAAVRAGNEYTVTFTAADMASIEGYQATLSFDNSALELVDIINGMATEEHFGLVYAGEGLITTSWHRASEASAKPLTVNTVLFSLVFRSKADGQLSQLLSIGSHITRAEAYDKQGEFLDVTLHFNGMPTAASDGFLLYQNTPNPFKGETLIGFNLPVDDKVTLTVSDVTGKVLKLVRLDGVKGYNNVSLNSSDLPPMAIGAGVLYYTVETSEYTATKKMVIIE